MTSGSWVNEELSMWNWRDLGAALREIEADFTTDASSPQKWLQDELQKLVSNVEKPTNVECFLQHTRRPNFSSLEVTSVDPLGMSHYTPLKTTLIFSDCTTIDDCLDIPPLEHWATTSKEIIPYYFDLHNLDFYAIATALFMLNVCCCRKKITSCPSCFLTLSSHFFSLQARDNP